MKNLLPNLLFLMQIYRKWDIDTYFPLKISKMNFAGQIVNVLIFSI